ncbi:MAG: uracil-DNA glycosylase [Holosporales bacterium]
MRDPRLDLLALHLEAGVDEIIAENPSQKRATKEAQLPRKSLPSTAIDSGQTAKPQPSAEGIAPTKAAPKAAKISPSAQAAHAQAMAAQNLEELQKALLAFEGCDLKKTAMNTVFADGNSKAPLMFIGEAPGADEDRQGKPFVGLSGQLLDRMIAAIGRDRTSVYISNVIPWRPAGNRQPTPAEIAQCLPFIRRHIEIVQPKVIVLLGGTAVKAMLETNEGITRLRGRFVNYTSPGLDAPIATVATFHPAFLLRSPGQKRYAWRDFLMIKERLTNLSA